MSARPISMNRMKKAAGFTLIELLIVVIILAILAAVALPQFNNSTSDAKSAALDSNLASMRSAIDLYYQQHGEYPGVKTSKSGPTTTGTQGTGDANTRQALIDQLTMYSTAAGQTSTLKDDNYKYGPYLKKGLPSEPMTASSDVEISTAGVLNMAATSSSSVGWKFDVKTGQLIANSTAYQSR